MQWNDEMNWKSALDAIVFFFGDTLEIEFGSQERPIGMNGSGGGSRRGRTFGDAMADLYM